MSTVYESIASLPAMTILLLPRTTSILIRFCFKKKKGSFKDGHAKDRRTQLPLIMDSELFLPRRKLNQGRGGVPHGQLGCWTSPLIVISLNVGFNHAVHFTAVAKPLYYIS